MNKEFAVKILKSYQATGHFRGNEGKTGKAIREQRLAVYADRGDGFGRWFVTEAGMEFLSSVEID